MERGCRPWRRATLLGVSLLLCMVASGMVQAGPLRKGGPTLESGVANSIRLSIKISGVKKRNRQVSFYKSVARQGRNRPSGGRSPSSER